MAFMNKLTVNKSGRLNDVSVTSVKVIPENEKDFSPSCKTRQKHSPDAAKATIGWLPSSIKSPGGKESDKTGEWMLSSIDSKTENRLTSPEISRSAKNSNQEPPEKEKYQNMRHHKEHKIISALFLTVLRTFILSN